MQEEEIKAVFDRVFNGMPNPIFCHPVSYFECNGYLCEVAASASYCEIVRDIERELYRSPLDIFRLLFGHCGAYVTVITKDGEKTDLSGHIDSLNQVEQFKETLRKYKEN